MSKPKVSIKVGKLSRTLAETAVPTSAQKPKPFNEREQLAMAKALRAKRKMPEIAVDLSDDESEE